MATQVASSATATTTATLSCPAAQWIYGIRVKTVTRMARLANCSSGARARTLTEMRAAIRVMRRAHFFNRASTKLTRTTTMTLQTAMVLAARVRQLAVLERRLMVAPFDGRHVGNVISQARRTYEAMTQFVSCFALLPFCFVFSFLAVAIIDKHVTKGCFYFNRNLQYILRCT